MHRTAISVFVLLGFIASCSGDDTKSGTATGPDTRATVTEPVAPSSTPAGSDATQASVDATAPSTDWLTAPIDSLELCSVLSLESVAGVDPALGSCEMGGEWESQVRWPGPGYSLTVFAVDASEWGGDRAEQGQRRIGDGSAVEITGTGAALAWYYVDEFEAIADFGDRLLVVQLNGDSIPLDPAGVDLGSLLQEAVSTLST